MNKIYITPTTRVVILDAEDTILAASGERADTAGLFGLAAQRDYGKDLSEGSTSWGDSPTSGSPW